jgi:hypothetical protein
VSVDGRTHVRLVLSIRERVQRAENSNACVSAKFAKGKAC